MKKQFSLDAWNAWVREMTAVVEKHGLPKDASEETSPFVCLIEKLQQQMPLDYRHSLPLARAIRQARAELENK